MWWAQHNNYPFPGLLGAVVFRQAEVAGTCGRGGPSGAKNRKGKGLLPHGSSPSFSGYRSRYLRTRRSCFCFLRYNRIKMI